MSEALKELIEPGLANLKIIIADKDAELADKDAEIAFLKCLLSEAGKAK